MARRDFYNICTLFLLMVGATFAQSTQVRCINPQFDELVADYLDPNFPVISVADAYEAKDKYVFLDAREKDEFDTSHIPKAIHVGYDHFDLDKVAKAIPQESHIIVYCSIGYRSEHIAKKLKDKGYQNVFNLYGSIFEWVNQNRPLESDRGKPSKNVHSYNKKWSKWIDNDAFTISW